jgi:hypothetical protein
MQAHALRHILLKALAFGVMAVMLTGVCAAQEDDMRPDEKDFGKLKWMENFQPKDSIHLQEYIDSYKAFIEKWKGKSPLIDASKLYIAMAEFERKNYDTVDIIARELAGDTNLSTKANGLEILIENSFKRNDFNKALDYTIQFDSTNNNIVGWCGNARGEVTFTTSRYYTKAYRALGDTIQAVKYLLKTSIFKYYYNEKDSTELLTLLKGRYTKADLKREFDNSIENLQSRKVDNYDEYYFTFLKNEVAIPLDLSYPRSYIEKAKTREERLRLLKTRERDKTKDEWIEIIKSQSFYQWLSN